LWHYLVSARAGAIWTQPDIELLKFRTPSLERIVTSEIALAPTTPALIIVDLDDLSFHRLQGFLGTISSSAFCFIHLMDYFCINNALATHLSLIEWVVGNGCTASVYGV
jgi:hypothetical protein